MLELFMLLAVFGLGVVVGRSAPRRGGVVYPKTSTERPQGSPPRPPSRPTPPWKWGHMGPQHVAPPTQAQIPLVRPPTEPPRRPTPPLPSQLEGCTFDQIERWMIAQGYYGKTEIAETLARLKTPKSWTPRPMSERQPYFSNDGRNIPSMKKALEPHRSKRHYMDGIDESETL